jgi:hypothetical protein
MRPDHIRILVVACSLSLVGACIVIGSIFIGINIGREQTMRTVTDTLRGSGSLKELEKLKSVDDNRRPSYSTQGTLVQHKEHFIIIQDKDGRLRSVQIVPDTKIKIGTSPGGENDIGSGATIAVIGQPMPDGGIRALVLQVEK